MLGEKALKLVQNLQQSLESCHLPAYDEEKIKLILQEIDQLHDANQNDALACGGQSSEVLEGSEDPDDGAASGRNVIETILLRHEGIERNKRCLLAYHYHRLHAVKEYRWNFGAVLPKDLQESVTGVETHWLRQYNLLLGQYMRASANGLDLTQHLQPPKALLVEVRCVEDYGELVLEDGQSVLLQRGSHHQLPRADCEPLIRSGILEHIVNDRI